MSVLENLNHPAATGGTPPLEGNKAGTNLQIPLLRGGAERRGGFMYRMAEFPTKPNRTGGNF